MNKKYYSGILTCAFSVIICLLILSCQNKGTSSDTTTETDEGLSVVEGRLINGQGEEIYGKHDDYTFGYKGKYILVTDYRYNSDRERTDTLNGILTETGEEILPCKYIFYTFENGYIRLSDPDGKDGMMTPELKLVVPCIYSSIYIEKNDYPECITVYDRGKYGKLDLEGNVLVPCEYNLVVLRNNEEFDGFLLKAGYAYISNDGGRGLYSIKEKREIIPTQFKKLSDTYGDFIGVKKNDKFGIYSYSGIEVVPCSYKVIMLVEDKFYASAEKFYYDSLPGTDNVAEFDIFTSDGEFIKVQQIAGSELSSLCRRAKKTWERNWKEYD